jgi:hypothetical protein
LRVRSDRFIPDLIPAEFDLADVEISFEEYPESARGGSRTLCYTSNGMVLNGEPAVRLFEIGSPSFTYQLVYWDGTEFMIDHAGSKVWATWPDKSTFEDTLTYLLGPVLGFVLRLRGVTCLHASAIAVDGVAIALTGPGGAGKSTAAAQFSAMDYPVLSDDIATLSEAGSSFLVHPSPARLRLWPSSVEHLYGDSEALPRLTPSWEKQYLDLRNQNRRFQSTPLPLAAIYIISNPRDSADRIVEVPRSAGMMQLLGNVYVKYFLDERFRARDFVRIAAVANTVAVRQLNLRHDFTALEQTCHAILTDVDHLRSGNRQTSISPEVSHPFVSCLD